MKKPKNPFLLTGYYSPEYFCDREQESKDLKEHLRGGLSTVLLSARRLGKTGLIKHVQYQLKDEMLCIYLDIINTENLTGFLSALSTAIINAVPEKSGFGSKIWKVIKSLRPVFSFDSMTGDPQVTFDISKKEAELQIENLFNYLNEYEKPVFIAIDEFQQITSYPEENTDAYLRSKIQQLGNIVFVFSGSQQTIMRDLFSLPEKPFFRSATFLKLEKIDREIYKSFISNLFANSGKKISDNIIYEMLDWTETYTYYVQLLCNRVFLSDEKEITTETWRIQAAKILKEHEFIFINYRNMLTGPQWQLLKAIAHDGQVYAPTSKDFISSHSLGSPATVLRSLQSLIKMEQIIQENDTNGRSFYRANDFLFRRWIDKK